MANICNPLAKLAALLKKDPSGVSGSLYLDQAFSAFSEPIKSLIWEEAELIAYPPKTEADKKRLARLRSGRKIMQQRTPLRHQRLWD